MANRKPPDDPVLKGWELERDIHKAVVKTIDLQAGKNVSSQDFSNLPRKEAIEILDKLAGDNVLKRLCHNRYQRTNASVDLETQKHFRDAIKKAETEITNHNSKNLTIENKTMPIEIDPTSRKVIARTGADAHMSQAKRDEIMATVATKKAKLQGTQVKNDLSVASNPEPVPSLHDRLQRSLLPVAGLSSNARIVKVAGGKSLALSSVSSASPVAVIGEGSPLSGADLEVSGNVVNFSKLSSRIAASQEIFEDAPAIVESAIADASRNVWSGVDDLIVSAVVADVDVVERNVAIADLALFDINALCASANVEKEDEPVLVFNSSFFRSVVADLLDAQGKRLHQEGDQLYWNDFKIVLSDSLAGGSASAGDCVAISGSIKKGITVVERSAIQYERKDEILSAQDKALLHIHWRGGAGVQNPAALSRLVLS